MDDNKDKSPIASQSQAAQPTQAEQILRAALIDCASHPRKVQRQNVVKKALAKADAAHIAGQSQATRQAPTDDEVVEAHNLGFAAGLAKGRREAASQATKAQAEPIYQIESRLRDGMHWRDTNEQVYNEHFTACRRIVYAAAPQAPVAMAERLDENERDMMAAEMKRLHDALCFWLPENRGDLPPAMIERIAGDAYLLVGIDDLPDLKTAEELGWISVAATKEAESVQAAAYILRSKATGEKSLVWPSIAANYSAQSYDKIALASLDEQQANVLPPEAAK